MNRLRALIRSVFAFSRSETNGFLILLPAMVLIVFSEPVYRYWFVRQPQDFSQDSIELDSLVATWKWEKEGSTVTTLKTRTFPFDPNVASKEDFISLGFSKSYSNRIAAYRAKGGKFHIKSDLLKIHGADTALYQNLYSFINLPELRGPNNLSASNERIIGMDKINFKKSDLNEADTTQLMKVYGIGKKLSERIIKYRDRLGGFISIEQLKEVYGLDSALLSDLGARFLVYANYEPHLIPLNNATGKELSSHPYLSFKLANAIVAYRFQHGKFDSLDDLAKVQLMTEADIKRIRPYLTLNP
jgi:competence protein ComEA